MTSTMKKTPFEREYKLNLKNNPLANSAMIENIINKVFHDANSRHGKLVYPFMRINPQNQEVYQKALTHTSFVEEMSKLHDPRNSYIFPTAEEQRKDTKLSLLCKMKPTDTYEKLETLGDSVLGLAVTDYLFEKFPGKDEKFMTITKARLVQKQKLAHFSKSIGLVPFIMISSFHEQLASKNQGRNHPSIQEDIFEAFLGAIYTDFTMIGQRGLGFEIATNFVRAVVELYGDLEYIISHNENFKDSLIRFSQANQSKVEFVTSFTEGKTNNRVFAICAYIPKSTVQKIKRETESANYHYKTQEMLYKLLTEKQEDQELCMQIRAVLQDKKKLEENYIVGFGHAKTKKAAEQSASKAGLICLGIDLNY